MQQTNFAGLSKIDQTLLQAAAHAMANSYSPYSGFRVGAAVRTKSGRIFAATNMESADYIVQHAETLALGQANSVGEREIEALAVIARKEIELLDEPCAPCGACRQQIFEFRSLTGCLFPIFLSNTDMSKIVVTDIDELLPLAFGPATVTKPSLKRAGNSF